MRERAAGTTVSILTVFSFYGAEDYCTQDHVPQRAEYDTKYTCTAMVARSILRHG